jgi:hypothetical protein
VTTSKQRTDEVATDKSFCSGDKYFHYSFPFCNANVAKGLFLMKWEIGAPSNLPRRR